MDAWVGTRARVGQLVEQLRGRKYVFWGEAVLKERGLARVCWGCQVVSEALCVLAERVYSSALFRRPDQLSMPVWGFDSIAGPLSID